MRRCTLTAGLVTLALLAARGPASHGVEGQSGDLTSRRAESIKKVDELLSYRRFDDALAAAQEAVGLSRQLFGDESTEIAGDLHRVTRMQLERDDYAAAEAQEVEVLRMREAVDAERPWLALRAQLEAAPWMDRIKGAWAEANKSFEANASGGDEGREALLDATYAAQHFGGGGSAEVMELRRLNDKQDRLIDAVKRIPGPLRGGADFV